VIIQKERKEELLQHRAMERVVELVVQGQVNMINVVLEKVVLGEVNMIIVLVKE
jgi:hypothetical protein